MRGARAAQAPPWAPRRRRGRAQGRGDALLLGGGQGSSRDHLGGDRAPMVSGQLAERRDDGGQRAGAVVGAKHAEEFLRGLVHARRRRHGLQPRRLFGLGVGRRIQQAAQISAL